MVALSKQGSGDGVNGEGSSDRPEVGGSVSVLPNPIQYHTHHCTFVTTKDRATKDGEVEDTPVNLASAKAFDQDKRNARVIAC